MSKIKDWLSNALGVARHPVRAADEFLERKMTCPECGHGGTLDPVERAAQADGCDCTDEWCACSGTCPFCGHASFDPDFAAEDRITLASTACDCADLRCSCHLAGA